MVDAERQDADVADVRRVLQGDATAFGGIVERWQGRLVNLAWRFCRDRTMAEDMAQDAFVRAFRALGTFRGESAFSTWLTAIAVNSYRSAVRDRHPIPVGIAFALTSTFEPGPLAGLVAQEQASAVRQL
jgi:RNA polymerase sigma-70 factor (ECF subfamily)